MRCCSCDYWSLWEWHLLEMHRSQYNCSVGSNITWIKVTQVIHEHQNIHGRSTLTSNHSDYSTLSVWLTSLTFKIEPFLKDNSSSAVAWKSCSATASILYTVYIGDHRQKRSDWMCRSIQGVAGQICRSGQSSQTPVTLDEFEMGYWIGRTVENDSEWSKEK